MSSGFVSGGTNEEPTERDDEWVQAQNELEESRRRKAELSRQQGGKTLYETLQANKAAKQEAFEESIRLRNQFRSLDDDEVDFLDSVLESTRAQEAAIKKETTEQLEAFRKQQELADNALLGGEATQETTESTKRGDGEEQWALGGRKRKKGRQDEFKSLKLRKTSSTGSDRAEGRMTGTTPDAAKSEVTKKGDTVKKTDNSAKEANSKSGDGTTVAQTKVSPPANNLLGLGSYDSDDDS